MEKREFPRRRVLKRVHVSFSDKNVAVECILRNLSEHGALIEFSDSIMMPNSFMLHNEWDGYKIECEIVTRTRNSAGVKFLGQKVPINVTRRQVVNALTNKYSDDLPDESCPDPSPGKIVGSGDGKIN